MIALQINNTKNFMNSLLISDQFDSFLTEEATITTFNTFHIDGHIVKDFFDSEETDNLPLFSSWSDIKPFCFQIIKGKKTPVSFHVVLHATPSLIEQLAATEACTITANLIRSLALNIRYDNGKVSCITASALTTFIPDKSIDKIWDNYICQFFTNSGLDFEEA